MGKDIPEIITASISWLNEHQLIKLLAYVLMPDHIHMLFRLGTIKTLDQVMQQFGSYTGHRIADKLGYRFGQTPIMSMLLLTKQRSRMRLCIWQKTRL